jgi:hypothetical protein
MRISEPVSSSLDASCEAGAADISRGNAAAAGMCPAEKFCMVYLCEFL